MQHYKNHRRFVFTYNILTWVPTIALFVGAIINVTHSSKENIYSASLILLIAIVLMSILIHARNFALKAQDRAVRAEENLRHYILTGRPLDSRLSLSQVIGLRFASDEEFPSLAQKAADEGMSNDEIKKSVKNWRPDFHRV